MAFICPWAEPMSSSEPSAVCRRALVTKFPINNLLKNVAIWKIPIRNPVKSMTPMQDKDIFNFISMFFIILENSKVAFVKEFVT